MASWTCTTCSRTMQLENKDEHLAGQKHADALNAQGSSGGMALWTCTTCNRTMQLEKKNEHLAGQKHANALNTQGSSMAPWTCTTCNRTMQLGTRNEHLAGQQHANALIITRQGPSPNRKALRDAVTLHVYTPKGYDSAVTMDDDKASDDWEAMKLLRGWGLLPGGAYKESNHFGDYDYY